MSDKPNSFVTRFPADIKGDIPYLHFKIMNEKPISIFLPQPPGLAVEDGAAYGAMDLTVLEGGGEAIKNYAGALVNTSTNASNADLTAGALLGKEGFQGLFGADTSMVGSALALNKRIAVNKYQRATYETQNIRSFTFAFKFAAQNQDDTNRIIEIENIFRKATYPKKLGGIALQYPPVVEVEFKLGEDRNFAFPKIFRTQITSFNTTYNQSTNAFYKSGAPIEVDMSITLQEDTQLYRDEGIDDQLKSDIGMGVLTNYAGGGEDK